VRPLPVLPVLVALAGGCTSSLRVRTIPRPLVQNGSPIAYMMTMDEVQTPYRDIKGEGVYTRVERTRFTAFDLRHCRAGATHTLEGSTSELGWGRDPGDLWVWHQSTARSLSGATLPLSTLAGYDLPPNLAPPVWSSYELGAGLLQVWDFGDRKQAVLRLDPAAPAPAVRHAQDGRTLVISIADGEVLEVLSVDVGRASELEKLPRVRLPRVGGKLRAARLMAGKDRLMTVSELGSVLVAESFDLSSGARLKQVDFNQTDVWALGSDGTAWLIFATAGDPRRRDCRSRLNVVDLASGAARELPLPTCAATLEWLGDGPFVGMVGYGLGRTSYWTVDVQRLTAHIADEAARSALRVGDSLYYRIQAGGPGQPARQYLRAHHLPSGRARAVTGDLGELRFVAAEPASQTLIAVDGRSRIYLLDARSGRLRSCSL